MKKCLILFLLTIVLTCTSCNNHCDHEMNIIEEVQSTCYFQGYILENCNKCNLEIKTPLPLNNHTLEEHSVIVPLTYTQSEQRKYICTVCNEEVIKEISFETLVNKTNSLNDFPSDIVIENTQELYEIIDLALVKGIKSFKFKGTFSNEFILKANLISYIIQNTTSFNTRITKDSDIYEVTLEYNDYPLYSTQLENIKKQNNLNIQETEKTRSEDFNDFPIEKVKESLEVETTEQLSTCLMKGIKPICKENSSAYIIYETMKEILRNIINDNMSDFEKLLAIHDYICSTTYYDYIAYEQNLNPMDYDCGWLEGVFLKQVGLCGSLSNAFMSLCNIEGIICVTVKGVSKQNSNIGHAWNKVYLDSNWYIVDLTGDIVPLQKDTEVTLYQSFLIDDSYYKKYYDTYIYNDLACNLNYDKYSKMTYIYQDRENDFLINDFNELVHLISYLESNNNSTISFKMNYNYNDFNIELNKAYSYLKLENDSFYYTSQLNEYIIAN